MVDTSQPCLRTIRVDVLKTVIDYHKLYEYIFFVFIPTITDASSGKVQHAILKYALYAFARFARDSFYPSVINNVRCPYTYVARVHVVRNNGYIDIVRITHIYGGYTHYNIAYTCV